MTDKDVGEALGWVETYDQHSEHWKTIPYWDNNGGFMTSSECFHPTTDMDDALNALDHLIDSEKITEMEVCELICEFIVNRKK